MRTLFLKKLKKVTSGTLVLTLLFSVLIPLGLVSAAVDTTGNTISAGNSGYVNLSNSGAYPVTFTFSGTLDAGDVVYLDVMSGSTAVKSYTGSQDGSGSKTFTTNLSSGVSNGALIFSGSVYASGSATPYATGIVGTGTGDFITPTATIVYSGTTNPPVIATLTGANEPITVTNNSGALTKTFAANGSFTFDFVDVAGNTGLTTATVSGIITTPPALVNLGSASNFAILAKTAISNISTSIITGNIGVSPAAGTFITGLACSEVTGTIYTANDAGPACRVWNDTLLTTAVGDMETAYTNAAGRINPTATELGAGDISGLTIAPGLYKWGTDVAINSNVTLSGSASDVWIFQIAGNLNIASAGNISSGVKILLSGGALASNIFWQVGGLTGATFGTYSTFNGTVLSAKQVILQTGAVLNGRALAKTQVTLHQNTVASSDTIAPTATVTSTGAVTLSNSGAYSISGVGSENLSNVIISFSGSAVTSATVSTGGTSFTGVANLSSFDDGTITYSINPVDIAGNSGTILTGTVLKHTAIGGSLSTASGSFIYLTGSLDLAGLDTGAVYGIYSGSTLVSSGVLVANNSTGSLVLNPSYFTNFGQHTLTLSGADAAYGTSNASLDSKTYFIGPVNYATLYNSIGTTISASGIANNFTGVTNANVTDFTNLYFEKPQYGKILFSTGLDLTNSGTISFLQSLPSYLDMTDGHIGFNTVGSVFQNYGAELFMYFTGANVPNFSGNSLDYITPRDESGNLLLDALTGSTLLCAVGVGIPYQVCTFANNHFTSFDFNPYVISSHIQSNNASGALAKSGDTVTVSFTGSESLTGVTATIGGQSASITGSSVYWQASRTMTGSDSTGNIVFTINFTDIYGNIGTTVTGTTNSSNVYFQTNTPEVTVTYSPATATGGSVVATLTGTGSNPATSFSGSSSHTFTDNGSYTFIYYDAAGNVGSTVSSVTWIDKIGPVVSGKMIRNITQTGAIITFNFSETNFSSGTGYTIVYTGGNVSNFVETGALSLSFSSGNGSGSTTLIGLTGSTNYDYLMSLTDSFGNISSNTGAFTTAGTPIALTGGTSTQTGSVTLTGANISTGSTLDLSGTTLTISSDSNNTSFITGSLSIAGTNISVTGATAWNGILIPPTLIDNTTIEAATGSEIGTGITVTQTIQVGAEGASLVPSTSTGYFNVSFVVPGYSSGTVLDLYRSDDGTVWTRVSPDGSCTLDANSLCSFRTNHLSFFAPVVDSVPDAFSFSPVTGAELSTDYTSATTVAGINTGSTITISGGQYKIGAGSYTGSAGTVNSGDIVTVKVTSSSAYFTAVSTTLTIGGVNADFSVTTKAVPSSGGSGGGSVATDYCPSGDTSNSYYDGKCSGTTISTDSGVTVDISKTKGEVIITTTTATGVTTTIFKKPGVALKSLSDIKFTDISSNWAKGYIEHLVARGVVNNVEEYKPDNNLTRAEFLKIAFNAAGWNTNATSTTIFNDVATDSWYAPYVSLALSKGIISDKSTNFRPNDTISRAEAAKVIVGIFGGNTANRKITFEDVDVSSDLTKYIETAKILGFFSGQVIDGKLKFRPNDSITRAEIAKIVVNAFGL